MNKDELKLHIELVPQSLWYLNPRTAMGRKAIYASQGCVSPQNTVCFLRYLLRQKAY